MTKSHMVQSRENMEVTARVGFRVWLRNFAQVGDECGGAFSWLICQFPDDHVSARLRRIASRRQRRTFK